MYSWGQNNNGQLGLGGIQELHLLVPTEVRKLNDLTDKIRQISSGSDHSIILTNDGAVYTCGSNDFFQLGHSYTQSRFQQITTLSSYKIEAIACGDYHTMALDEWGKVFSWGNNRHGQLGHKNLETDVQQIPKIIKCLGAHRIIQICCGANHSMALGNTGVIFVWGDNSEGQLGLGGTSSNIPIVSFPVPLEYMTGLVPRWISCGDNHSLLISISGAVYTWGQNNKGQLGHGDKNNRNIPSEIKSLRNSEVVYASSGKDHTLVLTLLGRVFSFGSSHYGQLGQGCFSDENTPRQIMELMGTSVSQIACGRYHSLAYIPSRDRLYSFGLGGSGQLGKNSLANENIPQVVHFGDVSQMNPPGRIYRMLSFNDELTETPIVPKYLSVIGAGGNMSYAAISSSINTGVPEVNQVKFMNSSYIDLFYNISSTEPIDIEIIEDLELIFQSPSCINASFLLSIHRNCNSKNLGVDLNGWKQLFSAIAQCSRTSIKDLITESITLFLIPKLVSAPPDIETLRIYVILFLFNDFEDENVYKKLHVPFASKITALNSFCSTVLEKWLSNLTTFDYFEYVVRNFKKAVIQSMKENTSKEMSQDTNLLLSVLSIFSRLRFSKPLMQAEDFYISDLTKLIDLPHAFGQWLLHRYSLCERAPYYLCHYPFIFDAFAKTTLLELDQHFQMEIATQRTNFLEFLFNPASVTYTTFVIRRDNLLEDALTGIRSCRPSNLKKPLRIKFANEEAEDAGGVKKEFFLLFVREILSPNYGIFCEYENYTIWFSRYNFENPEMFYLFGVMCGLAIYNFIIINLRFPLPMYKKLLNLPVGSIEDLAELSPTVAKSLSQILKFESEEELNDLCLNFTYTEEVFGTVNTINLKKDGESIDVNLSNRNEYVDLYIDYLLNKSIETQYKAFHNGFHQVCGGYVLELFTANELMTLVAGNESYDWKELEANTSYKNGYSETHTTIINFWSVFHSFSEDNKKKFLLFLTGTDRVPILGMKALKLIIQKTCDENYFPVAHTCFNLLELPEYKSLDVLADKLLQAIQHTEGFGLV